MRRRDVRRVLHPPVPLARRLETSIAGIETALPESLHEGHPAQFPSPPSSEEVAAIVEGNLLGAYVVNPAGGYRLAMLEVQPREQWPEGMFKCIFLRI